LIIGCGGEAVSYADWYCGGVDGGDLKVITYVGN